MSPELAYFLKINAGIMLFFTFYRMFLDKDTFFHWRRILLLCFLVVSMLYPLMNFQEWIKEQPPMVVMVDYYTSVMLPEVTITHQAETTDWTGIFSAALVIVYGAGVLGLAIRFLIQLTCIIRIRMQSRKAEIKGIQVYIPRKATQPFSFFHWVFIRPDLFSETELDEVLIHEQAHVRQGHSIDVVFSELMCIACWFNPFAWLLKQEIRNNLEYMADNRVLQSGHNYQSYQFHLLGLSHPKAAATLSNNFNVLPLKKRIKMMNKKRTKEIGKTKYLIFMPLVALLLVISNIEAVARTTKSLAKETIQLVEKTVAPIVDNNPTKQMPQPEKEMLKPANDIQVTDTIKASAEAPAQGDDTVFDMVDTMPLFPGDIPGLMSFINQNTRYPEEAAMKRIQGKVVVEFIVEKDGTTSNYKILSSVDPLLDEEALRVVRSMPQWTPGKMKGKLARVQFSLPILFRFSDPTPPAGEATTATAPEKAPAEGKNTGETIFDRVDVMPEFPGGQQALDQYVSLNLQYPKSAVKEKRSGVVTVQFVVDKTGKVINPNVVRGSYPEFDTEARRLIRDMPKWKPGVQNGENVNVKYVLPVRFKLAE